MKLLYSFKISGSFKTRKLFCYESSRYAECHELGKVARKGWASIWKAKYEIIEQNKQLQYHIREENAWVKVMDNALGQNPNFKHIYGIRIQPFLCG